MARSLSNKPKPKPKPHSQDDDDEMHNDDAIVTSTKKVWCEGCSELEDNKNYHEPKDMCAKCFYPIPIDQSKKKDEADNVCPRCGSDIFTNYIEKPTPEQISKILKQLEEQTVEQ